MIWKFSFLNYVTYYKLILIIIIFSIRMLMNLVPQNCILKMSNFILCIFYHNKVIFNFIYLYIYIYISDYMCAWLFAPPWTVACQAPLSMDFLGKNTGVDRHSLLQRIFLTQGLNLGFLHCRLILHHLSHQGSPLGCLLIKTTHKIMSVDQDVEKLVCLWLVHCWWEYKILQPLQKTVWQFLKKLKRKLSHDPGIPLLDIYQKEFKAEV